MALTATHTGKLKSKDVYSSKSHNWHSPPGLIQAILKAYNLKAFACDPCSDDRNVPARIVYGRKEDGLKQVWPVTGHLWRV